MLLDDERPQREGIARHVHWQEYGFEPPILCANGWEALARLEEQHVDVLFTDIRMPGMDGLELMSKASKISKSLFVVIISGYAEFEYAQQAIHNGARQYLLKPVKPEEIHRILAQFVTWNAARFAKAGELVPQGTADEILQLLQAHIAEGISLEQLAKAVHLNESYLCTLFKKERGETVTEALARMQLDRACMYLATTSLPMSEIAFETGGRTPSNFTQWFRKQAGITPNEYRRITKQVDKG